MTGAIHLKESFRATSHSVPLEIKLARDDAAGEISGYGAIFGNKDLHGDIIAKGAFRASLAEHKAQRTTPVMLWSHDQSKPIGTWDRIAEDDKGLVVSGKLNLDVQGGRDARSLLLSGALKGLSIGYAPDPRQTSFDKDTGARLLKSVKLYEISLVSIPANPQARIVEAKSIANVIEFERFLRAQGFAKAAARKLAMGGWPALATTENLSPNLLLDAVKAARAELQKGL